MCDVCLARAVKVALHNQEECFEDVHIKVGPWLQEELLAVNDCAHLHAELQVPQECYVLEGARRLQPEAARHGARRRCNWGRPGAEHHFLRPEERPAALQGPVGFALQNSACSAGGGAGGRQAAQVAQGS